MADDLVACLQTARAAIEECTGSLSAACQATLRFNLGCVLGVKDLPAASSPAARLMQRRLVGSALLSVLTALAEERHPGDDAWQTATLATLRTLENWLNSQLVDVDRFITCAAGRNTLQALVQRLHACCKGTGPPLSDHGVLAVVIAAPLVCGASTIASLQPAASIDPVIAADACMAASGLMLLAMLAQLFAAPHAPPARTVAGACTCPGRATGASTPPPGHARAGALVGTSFDVYGCTINFDSPLAALVYVASMCERIVNLRVHSLAYLARVGLRSLCWMLLAVEVDAARRRSHPRVFGVGAGGADLARFIDPALFTAAPPVATIPVEIHAFTGAKTLSPECAPACAACLSDQLMLVLEAAALVDDAERASVCYERHFNTLTALEGQGAATAGPLRDYWSRARPHVVARALEAARAAAQLQDGSESALSHARALQTLMMPLSWFGIDGCDAGVCASLDALCEAGARARVRTAWSPSLGTLDMRLTMLLSPGSDLLARQAAPPCTFVAAIVRMGKVLQVPSDARDELMASPASRAFMFDVLGRSRSVIASLSAAPRAGGGRGGALAVGAAQDGAAPTLGAGTLDRASGDADAATAGEGGAAEPRVALMVLMAARLQGPAAQWWLLEGKQALLMADERDKVVSAAALLSRQPLWDAVQRATHGRMVPFDSSASGSPGPSGQSRASAPRGGGAGPSACTAALRFLVELHDRLDPHALGIRLPGCYNPRCTNLSGPSEMELRVRMCSQCRVARYCSAACSKQHWRWHKAGCRPPASTAHAS